MIGVFDSGSGGLTVVRALRRLAPRVDILYLADTANFPYGTKSDEEIKRLTLSTIAKLRDEGATTIVSACNSVSAAVIRPMIELLGVRQSDVVEMVGLAVNELERRRVSEAALIATAATISSGMYSSLATRHAIRLHEIVALELAELIECSASEQQIASAIRAALVMVPSQSSMVVLGCTHFPLALETFSSVARELGREFDFFDPAEVVAEEAIRLHGAQGNGALRLMCTGQKESIIRHYATCKIV